VRWEGNVRKLENGVKRYILPSYRSLQYKIKCYDLRPAETVLTSAFALSFPTTL